MRTLPLTRRYFQIEINETKRSASYFLDIGDVGIQSIQVGSLTSLLDHSGKLFMALACL